MEVATKKSRPRPRKTAQVLINDTDTVTYQMSFVKGGMEKMDNSEKLTVSEYAQLAGCSVRYVNQKISAGEIPAECTFGKGGRSGKINLIPVTALTPNMRKKYERLRRKKEPTPIKKVNMEDLSEEERQEAALWMEILDEWKSFRATYEGPKAKADEAFEQIMQQKHPGINRQQLYRKQRLLKSHGPGGLVDMRGKHDNHKKAIPDDVWNVFEYYYLDESKKTVAECMRLAEIYFNKHGIEIPAMASNSTFARTIMDRIPAPVLRYEREGEKAFRDNNGMYIKRYYDDLHSNDIWVCDNHTFDIFVNDGECTKPVRVYLTGFLDVRSRKMVGWYVTMNPCSQATLYALRRGIERYGIPKHILADNGREFLTHDIGGRGHRKSMDWGHEAPTILQNLQIEFSTAQVRNARAKIIERSFREVKECFSRLFDGYTGGTTAERPERLKKTGKYASNFTPIEDFVRYVDKYIEGIFNYEKSNAIGMNGKSRNEVYANCLIEKRTAAPEELNLMLMRNSKPVKVQREGVGLRVYDTIVYFNSKELLYNHIGKKVYFRFNPDDLKEVRVYDEEDRFLCTAEQQGKLSYFASKDEIKEKMKELREFERMVKNYKKQKAVEAESALDLIMYQADQNLALGEHIEPKVLTPVRYAENVLSLPEAVGAGDMIDYSKMLEKMKGQGE